jgi:hypothetical protein
VDWHVEVVGANWCIERAFEMRGCGADCEKQTGCDAQLLCGNLCQLVNADVNRSLSGKMNMK